MLPASNTELHTAGVYTFKFVFISVGKQTGYRLDNRGPVLSRDNTFFSIPVSIPALAPTQPPILYTMGTGGSILLCLHDIMLNSAYG
jgi:hypothetical protein